MGNLRLAGLISPPLPSGIVDKERWANLSIPRGLHRSIEWLLTVDPNLANSIPEYARMRLAEAIRKDMELAVDKLKLGLDPRTMEVHLEQARQILGEIKERKDGP